MKLSKKNKQQKEMLSPGSTVRLRGYGMADQHYRQDLMALGLTPNVCFKVIRKAPFGDPIEIQVRNDYISLRQKDVALLVLERVEV